jgi:hypothetical protein
LDDEISMETLIKVVCLAKNLPYRKLFHSSLFVAEPTQPKVEQSKPNVVKPVPKPLEPTVITGPIRQQTNQVLSPKF